MAELDILEDPNTVYRVFDFCGGDDTTLGIHKTLEAARAHRNNAGSGWLKEWLDIDAWRGTENLLLWEDRGGPIR